MRSRAPAALSGLLLSGVASILLAIGPRQALGGATPAESTDPQIPAILYYERTDPGAASPGDAAADVAFRVFDAPEGGHPLTDTITRPRATRSSPRGPFAIEPRWLGRPDASRLWLEISRPGVPARRVPLDFASHDELAARGDLRGGTVWIASDPEESVAARDLRSSTNVATIVSNGPPANRVDLVVLGDGFTEAEIGSYASRAGALVSLVLGLEPLARYRNYFNVHRVDVISQESGIDGDPDCDVYRDTALNMSLPCGRGVLYIDVDRAKIYAALAPASDQVLVLAHTAWGGGVGYYYQDVCAMGGDPYHSGLALHEMGHSLGDLADEYFTLGETYVGGEPTEPNVSTYTREEMAQNGAKWARWLGTTHPFFNGPIDTYEGGRYVEFGLYRPSPLSRMRNVSEQFNLPSVENLISEIYDWVDPIDDATPSTTVVDEFTPAFVAPVPLQGSRHAIQWFVDDQAVPGATEATFLADDHALPSGSHRLAVSVIDTTSWVRNETLRAQKMTAWRWWDMEIGNHSPRVLAPAEVEVDEGASLAFSVDAFDLDGEPITSLTAEGSALGAGAVFLAAEDQGSGEVTWSPDFTRAGTYEITFTASNDRSRSATTRIQVRNVNRVPSITAPANASGDEGSLLVVTVSASDPDAEILGLSASGLPENALFLDFQNNTGSVQWNLGFDQSGVYPVTFLASDGYGGTASAVTAVTVRNVDRPPAVTAPAAVAIAENETVTFDVTAIDPDGQPITGFGAAPLPPGAGFVTNAALTAGTFSWTPGYLDAGTYPIVFTARSDVDGTATTLVRVGDVPRPPVVSGPSLVAGAEGNLLEFGVAAADPDGTAIDSLAADPLPPGAAFAVAPGGSSGSFSWTPGYDQAGSHTVTLSAKSACRAEGVSGPIEQECEVGQWIVTLDIANTDRAPIVSAPPTLTAGEGTPILFEVTASDPDGDAVSSLEAADVPLGAAFSAVPPSGTFAWIPTYDQAGTYAVTFTAANARPGSAVTEISIVDRNRAPSADPGGPYGGVVGAPVTMDGSGSSDPDGHALAYEWGFGDGSTGVGRVVEHSYAFSGEYEVALTVRDDGAPPEEARATTSATIVEQAEVEVLLAAADRSIRLGSARPTWCVRLESADGTFASYDIVPSSIRLRHGDEEIPALADKSRIVGDLDGDGADELAACFAKQDLRALFASVPPGQSVQHVVIVGALSNGTILLGGTDVEVFAAKGSVAVSVSPNPFLVDATMIVSTTRPGRVRISVFDLRGRLVDVPLDAAHLPAGYHDVRIGAGGRTRSRLASGIYYYRVEAEAGVTVGKFAVIR